MQGGLIYLITVSKTGVSDFGLPGVLANAAQHSQLRLVAAELTLQTVQAVAEAEAHAMVVV